MFFLFESSIVGWSNPQILSTCPKLVGEKSQTVQPNAKQARHAASLMEEPPAFDALHLEIADAPNNHGGFRKPKSSQMEGYGRIFLRRFGFKYPVDMESITKTYQNHLVRKCGSQSNPIDLPTRDLGKFQDRACLRRSRTDFRRSKKASNSNSCDSQQGLSKQLLVGGFNHLEKY